jgi:putative spermidine/putrescine transport system permease protein
MTGYYADAGERPEVVLYDAGDSVEDNLQAYRDASADGVDRIVGPLSREAITALFLSPLMIPHVVLGIAFLRFFTTIGIGGTFVGLVISHVVVVLPFALRLVLASAVGMDRSIENAAISLGASSGTTFRRVTLPLIAPGVASGWALAFIQSFDEVTMTVFIATPGTTTLPVRMFLYIQDNIDPLVTSVSACVIALTVAFLVVLDRLYGIERLLAGREVKEDDR